MAKEVRSLLLTTDLFKHEQNSQHIYYQLLTDDTDTVYKA